MQRGVPLHRPDPAGRPGVRLPQHVGDDGGWCPGSGEPPASGGWCAMPGCTARRGSLKPGSQRTDPVTVAKAAVAYQVRGLLTGGQLLPRCGVPLSPKPNTVTVEERDAFTTVVVLPYPDGSEHRVWVTVEAEDRHARREASSG